MSHSRAQEQTRAAGNGPALGERLLDAAHALLDEQIDFLKTLVAHESPTDVPSSQKPVHDLLADAFVDLGFRVRRIAGQRSGGQLYARPASRTRQQPVQLLLGHSDTVWPIGTLNDMPIVIEHGELHGPGTFDMKSGLAQIVFALRVLERVDELPAVTPVVFINSDEETGSADSRARIDRLARHACRVYVVEPAYGPTGEIKTARKGGGEFRITIHGKAAHAGLGPEAGASAIVELAHVILKLHALNDPERGITVNVGVVNGGLRSNVVAPECRAEVDARTLTMDDARTLEARVLGMQAETPGVTLHIEGGLGRPPLEANARNRALWKAVRAAGHDLGLELEDASVGGGSDGNFTSLYTATIDGLGAVGDGAHARHEFVRIDRIAERTALLARLLLLPPATESRE